MSNPKVSASSSGNRDYYAKWEVNEYTIAYITHGGKFKNDVISHKRSDHTGSTEGRSKMIETYNIESEEIILEAPTRKGMKFKGWIQK